MKFLDEFRLEIQNLDGLGIATGDHIILGIGIKEGEDYTATGVAALMTKGEGGR